MSTVAVKRLDHVSFTVGDLNQSVVAFYQRFRLQPIKSYSAEGSDTDEGTATTNAAMEIVWLGSESGNGPMLEPALDDRDSQSALLELHPYLIGGIVGNAVLAQPADPGDVGSG
jgi:hypothetical protein